MKLTHRDALKILGGNVEWTREMDETTRKCIELLNKRLDDHQKQLEALYKAVDGTLDQLKKICEALQLLGIKGVSNE